MLEVKELKDKMDCQTYLETLSKELQEKYNLSPVNDIRMYSIYLTNGNLDVMVGFEYLSDKFMVAIKQNGYTLGFTEKDILGNLSLQQVYNLLDKRLGKC